jgi:dihydrodipicolinate synthase/N-acetylneuraminate lyase
MARDPSDLKSCLKGIVGFGVTPFHQDLSINFEALRQNTNHLVNHCEALVALGNNGEIFSLSPEEQKQVARAVVDEARGRKPVLIGVGFSLPVSADLAHSAEACGADGILVLPPHYSNTSDDGLFEYYRSVAAATKLGAVLFQTPAFNFSAALLRRLAGIPNIVGMKDEHGDMKQFVRQWNAVGDRLKLMCGVGEILAPSYFALGVDAFTSGIINFMPETPRKILRLLQDRQFEAAARVVEREALEIFDLRGKRPGYTTGVIKEAMNLCGMNAGPSRPPLAPLQDADREELRSILVRLGVLKS